MYVSAEYLLTRVLPLIVLIGVEVFRGTCGVGLVTVAFRVLQEVANAINKIRGTKQIFI